MTARMPNDTQNTLDMISKSFRIIFDPFYMVCADYKKFAQTLKKLLFLPQMTTRMPSGTQNTLDMILKSFRIIFDPFYMVCAD